MKHNFGLTQDDLTRIIDIFSCYPAIEKVVLYGSRAKGNYRSGSDIDLTLIGMELNLKALNRISTDLDDLLLPYYFDLSIFSQITNKDLLDHIYRVGITIYPIS